jgi:peptidyl-prolyl cis-trans isomerase-like 4
MSVLFETSLGDLVIDLEVETCPKTCENFLKLCKVYYYNLNAFFNGMSRRFTTSESLSLTMAKHAVSKDFLAQVGDPTATGTGGESIWSYIGSEPKSVQRYFSPELVQRLKHTHKGTVSMAVAPSIDDGVGGCGSQFFVTLADNIDYLDGKHAVFGRVVEGLDTLDKLNDVYTDQDGRPFKDVRIRHVVILGVASFHFFAHFSFVCSRCVCVIDDPFPDPPGLAQPPSSPTRPPDNSTRIAEDEDPLATLPEEEEERIRREKAAAASALTLEMVGDLPFANVRPPENVLFVCKLNAVTRDEDLELIFSRFGTIMSCQVIRDKKTGDSLQYAFIEFDKREDAEQVTDCLFADVMMANGQQAYFKMQNVLIDDRRIWVDLYVICCFFEGVGYTLTICSSQSVARLNTSWSNHPKMGPKVARGGRSGFGGREDLEETRRYRDGGDEKRNDGYGMVFDVSDRRTKRSRSREHRRKRSRSPADDPPRRRSPDRRRR